MGRGKPFKASLSRLVSAGVIKKPVWMDVVEATKPPFQPISVTQTYPIVYPEDRLRSIYLDRNPAARRIPVNLRAKTPAQRHIADKFVSVQMDLMEKKDMPEDEAYKAAERVLEEEEIAKREFIEKILDGPLTDPSIKNDMARLYVASVSDSRRDQRIYAALNADVRPAPLPEEKEE